MVSLFHAVYLTKYRFGAKIKESIWKPGVHGLETTGMKGMDMVEEQKKVFKTAKIGGYQKEDVLAYIQQLMDEHAMAKQSLEDELAQLREENASLRGKLESTQAEVDEVKQQLVQQQESCEALSADKKKLEDAYREIADKHRKYTETYEQISKALIEAQSKGEEIVKESTAKAEGMLSQSVEKAGNILVDAKAKAERLLTESKAKADQMVADATKRSETILHDASEKKEMIDKTLCGVKGNIQKNKEYVGKLFDMIISTIEGRKTDGVDGGHTAQQKNK